MEIFGALSRLGFGELVFGHDQETGLRAIAAVHSTRLGPAIGGCRLRGYATETDAIEDVTRLGQAMTYKAALARLPHGGGKAVVLAPQTLLSGDRSQLFMAFGRFVDRLGGRYITTEDSGTSATDMDAIRATTRHVLGTSPQKGGAGDPSPFTAIGVRRGIEAIAHSLFGKSDLRGLHVALQGVGHVGTYLARELHQAGARLTITDVLPSQRAEIARELSAQAVAPEEILQIDCDIVAPCALGGAITEDLVGKLRCKAIAGAANNQLATPAVGRALQARGIFYAPDYAINAGGLIHVAEEYSGYNKERALQKTDRIYDTILGIIERSKKEKLPPEIIANRMADEIIAAGPVKPA